MYVTKWPVHNFMENSLSNCLDIQPSRCVCVCMCVGVVGQKFKRGLRDGRLMLVSLAFGSLRVHVGLL